MEIDRLIDMLSARQSPQALLRSDESVQVWNGTGWAAANTPLAGGQLNRMLGLIAPANVRAFVHDLNATYAFDYHHASGFYRVDVEAIKGKRTVFVTKLDPKGIPIRPRDAQEGMLDFGQTGADPINGAPTTPEVPSAPPTETQPSSQWKLEEVDEPFPSTPVAPKKVAPQRTVVSVPVAPATQTSAPPLPGTPSSGSQRFLPTTPQGTEQWYYGHADQSMGPHSKEEMAALIKSGALLPETMVFDSRVGDWQQAKLSALNGFFPLKTEGEWVNPSIKDWRPQTAGELKAEKAFVGLIGGSVVGALVLLVAWIGLAQYRGANRIHDYSAMFAQKVEADNAGTEALHNVHLTQDDDDREHMHYTGTGQYSNGFLADVDFNIIDRDFWAKPNDTTFTSTAHDFTPDLSALIKSKINSNLAKEESKVRVEEVDLSHGDGNSYSGTIRIGTKLRLPISAEITSYDKEGHIQNWTHDVSLD